MVGYQRGLFCFDIPHVDTLLRHETWDVYAAEIQDKSQQEVKAYYLVFQKKWKQLAGPLVWHVPTLSTVTKYIFQNTRESLHASLKERLNATNETI